MKAQNKITRLALLLAVLLANVFFNYTLAYGSAPDMKQSDQSRAYLDNALHATVEIHMSVNADQAGDQEIQGRGLGSLIRIGKKILLVTHNHWGELLQDLTEIEVTNASGQPVKYMFGSEFKSLVVYEDGGTLVLKAPEELHSLVSASSGKGTGAEPTLGDRSHLAAGETVLVVYHTGKNRKDIGNLEASVAEITQYEGLSALKLRSLNGQPILPGDSGGGIWYKGKLIGNMWATVQIESTSQQKVAGTSSTTTVLMPTDTSYAALFPQAALKSK